MVKKIQEIREAHAKEENFLLKYPTSSNRKAHEYIGYLLQQIEIKDKALGFYADKENYDTGPNGRIEETDATQPFISWVNEDAGERARAALKGEDINE
ncbi:hypothetical protein ABFT51_07525 [Paenibacillus peoriae]|uniref:hypothetical protein n=1 Tax=Paenibacillus peoriae TaxID=59893 RepID=UPI0032AEDEA2